MVNWNMIPGAGLMRLAWDTTKLAGVVMNKRKEKALVLAQDHKEKLLPYTGHNANKKMKEVFEEKNPEEIAKLFLPNKVVSIGQSISDAYWKIWDIYWLFLLLRICLVISPQPGYVHPDEYFQTIEVVAGDVFKLDVTRTWEFNATSPTRSIVVPMTLYGIPLYTLKLFNALLYDNIGITILNSYMIFVIPRLVMFGLSLIMDYCVFQTCLIHNHSFNRCLSTLASSYVMLVFAPRTLTNSIEMVMVTILMYLVSHCMKRTAETVYLQSLVQEAYDRSESIRERVELRKKKRKIPDHDFKHAIPISVICAVGLFNRPTYLVFACVPLFYWFQRGISNNSYFAPFMIFNFRIVSLAPGFMVTCLTFILADSLYYGQLTWTKLWELEMSWTDWKVAPLQFIIHNIVPGNLNQFGTHPLYTHLLVNLPLLFGPLGTFSYCSNGANFKSKSPIIISGIAAIISMITFLLGIILNKWHEKPAIRNVYALNMFTFIFSLTMFSLIPHQEPRCLIPLTVPIVLMNAHHLRKRIMGWRHILTLWYVFNIFMLFFYGFLHQAGVNSTVQAIGESIKYESGTSTVNVVFSNTFMPPKFLLLQSKRPSNAQKEVHNNPNLRFQFHDLANTNVAKVKDKLVTLASRAKYMARHKKIETLLVIPEHLIHELGAEAKSELTLRPVTRLGLNLHISTATWPSFDSDILFEVLVNPNWTVYMDFLSTLASFRLSVYKVDLGDVNSVEMNTRRSNFQ